MTRILITGAGGFVGRELARNIIEQGEFSSLTLFDIKLSGFEKNKNLHLIEGNIADNETVNQVANGGYDLIYHLATLPGGAAEGDRKLSRSINLDGGLNLIDKIIENSKNKPRIIFTSTIAVYPAPMPPHIDDDTKLNPFLTYGAHKLMTEIYLADLHRRGEAEVVTIRLSGIIARPLAPSGMKSAFISNVFHALVKGEEFICPTTPEGTIWAMSVYRCVDNLMHAAKITVQQLPTTRSVTLPALRFTMGELVNEICKTTKRDIALVKFEPIPDIQAGFANQPPLEAKNAIAAGFKADDSLEALVHNALDFINKQ
jgi:nucleoside-diphosphate-sugar epimerase